MLRYDISTVPLVSLNEHDVSSHMDLSRIILSDPVNKWLFSNIKKDIFLVGGYIRDLLRGGDVNKDKDYVLKANVREVALCTARKFNGTFIELRKDQTCRVALKNGQILDFSFLKGSIIEDLNTRDFTINAIAWSPDKGIIDPLNGKSDLKNKIISVVKPENLIDDPLRILRAYRIAAQLGLTIEKNTRSLLSKYAVLIVNAASERITEEFFKLLTAENASFYISMSVNDKILHNILNVTAQRIKLNIAVLGKFDRFITKLKRSKLFNSKILTTLDLNRGQGLSRLGLIRLFILLNNRNSVNDNICGKLRCSNSIINSMRKIQNGIRLSEGRITDRKLYDIFNASDDCVFEVALLVSVIRQRIVDKFLKRADDFVKFKEKPLIDGYQIQDILNTDPGVLIGDIQAKIQKRRFLGITRNKDEAINWIISNFT